MLFPSLGSATEEWWESEGSGIEFFSIYTAMFYIPAKFFFITPSSPAHPCFHRNENNSEPSMKP